MSGQARRILLGGGGDNNVCSWNVWLEVDNNAIVIKHEGGCHGVIVDEARIYHNAIEVGNTIIPTPWAKKYGEAAGALIQRIKEVLGIIDRHIAGFEPLDDNELYVIADTLEKVLRLLEELFSE